MNKKLTFCAALLGGSLAFGACNDDHDESPVAPNAAVEKAFTQRYPDAGRPVWETEGSYAVAEFSLGGYKAEAWFDYAGQWVLTETDLPFTALPEAVRNGFAGGPYADWKVEDADKLERPATATVYLIEVEKGEAEKDLYYDENGTLFKEIDDSNNQGATLPSLLSETIKNRIAQLYPGAVILAYELEKQLIEVDIRHDNRYKEAGFDPDGKWLYTEWEIGETELPDTVKQALQGPAYAGWRIDDIERIEKPEGVFFQIELEKGDLDRKVMFGENGVETN